MLRSCLLVLSGFIYCSLSLGQDRFVSSAPEIDPFNISPNQIGSIQNSVNLYNGSINLPLNLINIPSPGGLSMNVSIAYSSIGVAWQSEIWNLDAPTGILGMGWQMNIPKIVTDHKGTGTRSDDDYYLIEGGSSNKLILTSDGATIKFYKTKSYNFWTIKYFKGTDSWEITKENGLRFIYGDKNSGRNTIQYLIRWGNWIGNSSRTDNQSQQAFSWNLSEVKNLENDAIKFTYLNVNQKIGGNSGKEQTEASYISKIEDPLGRSVEFIYGNKMSSEYMEPHKENGSDVIDGYQEFYERKYVSRIKVKNSSDFIQSTFVFDYEFKGSGNKTKRLLRSVTKETKNGISHPATTFNYKDRTIEYSQPKDQSLSYILDRVVTPTGAQINFNFYSRHWNPYTQSYSSGDVNSLSLSKLDEEINAPSNYAEPVVKTTNDYVAVTWRQLYGGNHHNGDRDVKLYAYRWDGRWKSEYLTSIGNVRMVDGKQDFEFKTSKDFFAILKPMYSGNNYKLFIYLKDEKNSENWIEYKHTIDVGSDKPKLLIGEDYVAVGERRDADLHTYRLQGRSWNYEKIAFNLPFKELVYYANASNYILRHATTGTDVVEVLYLDEDGLWKDKRFPHNPGMNTNTEKESFWYASNSFATVMAEGGNEFIYHWDENFENVKMTNTGVGYHDINPVIITGNSIATFLHTDQMKSFAFDGVDWKSKLFTDTESPVVFGNNMVLSSDDNYSKINEFDPNTLTWKVKKSLNRSYEYYDWFHNQNRTGKITAAFADHRSLVIGSTYYFRSNNGWWNLVENSETPSYFDWSFELFPNKNGHKANMGTYHIGKPSLGSFQDIINFHLNDQSKFRSTKITSNSRLIRDENNSILLSQNIVVSWKGEESYSVPDANDVRKFYLHRIANFKAKDSPIVHPVKSISIEGTDQPLNINFEYDFTTGLLAEDGRTPSFNKVTVFPGDDSKALGYTEHYFFNGLNSSESAMAFPIDNGGNTNQLYALCMGLPYAQRLYDGEGQLISTSKTSYKVFEKSIYCDTELQSQGYFVRPVQSISQNEGIEQHQKLTYDLNTGLKTRVESYIRSGSSLVNTIVRDLTYWWEVYDPSKSINLLTPVIHTKTTKNGIVIAATASIFTGSTVNPRLSRSYVWERSGSPDFSNWHSTTEQLSNWAMTSKITQRDNLGRVLETKDNQGVFASAGLNEEGLPIWSASNARYNQVYYNDFENSAGTTAAAKTGERSHIGPFTVVVPTGAYKLTFWQKNGSQNWQFVERIINGNEPIGGSNIYVDQIRAVPLDARIATVSYDRYNKKISETDVNNLTTYYEYDQFDRLEIIRDHEKNIISKFSNYYHNDTRRLSVHGDLDFDEVLLNESLTKKIELRNDGFETLTISSLTMPNGFTGNFSGTIAPGEFEKVDITFNPTADRYYYGNMIINADNSSGKNQLSVYGKGKAIRIITVNAVVSGAEQHYFDFGEIPTGTSQEVLIRIYNEGNDALSVWNIEYPNAYSGPFEDGPVVDGGRILIDEDGSLLDGNGEPLQREEIIDEPLLGGPVAFTIQPGNFYELTVNFNPQNPIEYLGNVLINGNHTDGVNYIQLSGSGKPERTVSLSESLAFGTLNVGSTNTKIIEVRNTGNETLTINSIEVPNGYEVDWLNNIPVPIEEVGPEGDLIIGEEEINTEITLEDMYIDGPITLGTGESRTMRVVFNPTSPIDYNGNLIFNGDLTDGSDTQSISGSGRKTRLIALSGNLDFGTIDPGTNTSRNLIITNNGNSPLNVTSIAAPSGYVANWTGTVSPGGSVTVPVDFNPIEPILYQGNLSVSSNKTGGSNTISVTGRGTVTRTIQLAGNLAFGDVQTGQDYQRDFTITNTGNSTLNVFAIEYPFGFSGESPSIIPLEDGSGGESPQPIGEEEPVLGMIAIDPGNSVTIQVNFRANNVANYSGNIVVSSNKTSGNASISASGRGVPSRIISIAGDLNFGTKDVGSTTSKFLTITNQGNSNLNISDISFPNGYEGGFWSLGSPTPSGDEPVLIEEGEINEPVGSNTLSNSITLSPGESEQLRVEFKPLAPTNYNGNLSLISNATSGTNSIATTGAGRKTRIVRLTGNLSFGEVTPNTSVTRNLRIYNDGNSTLTVNSISSPGGFSGSWSGTIAAGSYKNVTMTFRPTTSGANYSGKVTVHSNKTSGTHTRNISGQGLGTRVIRLTGNLSFGDVPVNTLATRNLRIYNDGTTTLTINGIISPAGFSGNWSGNIAPGAYRNVTITFRPTARTFYGGSISVSSNKTSGTNSRGVNGNGILQLIEEPRPTGPLLENPF